MAKGDFDVEEPVYGVDESVNNVNKDANKSNNDEEHVNSFDALSKNDDSNNLYHQDYGENSDFSNIGLSKDLDYIDSSSVVFEDKTSIKPGQKAKDFVSTINKKALMAVVAVVIVIFVIILIIFINISNINASYHSDVIIPDLIYMGETGNISVVSYGKKDLDKTVTSFKSSNENILTMLNDKATGKDVMGTMIPVQEGKSTVIIDTMLNNRKMANVKKKVVVCPAFNSDLLLTNSISVVKDSVYSIALDLGDAKCAKGVSYSSSNEEIMTVSKEGDIKGISSGEAILTIKKGSRSISVNVTITDESIDLSDFSISSNKIQLSPGEKHRINIFYSPANASSVRFNMISTDESVVSISDGGVITAVNPGETTINVKSPSGISHEIQIIVSNNISDNDGVVTQMSLSKDDISLVQGESEKIKVMVTPDNVKDKTVTWKSSNEQIATVSDGVIFGRNVGNTTVTASTNNGISKTVNVTVDAMRLPVIKASDNIETNLWHFKPYVLNFSGSSNGATYYYGKTKDKFVKGDKVVISKDERTTYYVKACKNNVCSDVSNYVSMLDVTKPQVVTVAGISNYPAASDVVQIAYKDTTSYIQKWCVTKSVDSASCNWKTIATISNPVVSYTAVANGVYYAFARDAAGNVSDGYKFEIANIE